MKLKWIVNSLIIMLFCLLAALGLARHDSAVAADNSSEKVEALLLDQITADGSADFIVRFTDQVDLSAAYSMDWDARGKFVFDTLRETAERSQANAKVILDMQSLKYQTFISGNELYVWGNNQVVANGLMATNELKAINALAAMPEVSNIRASRTYSIDPVVVTQPFEKISWAGDYLANNSLTTVGNSTEATTDWGIIDTKANQFWTTFGVQGDAIVVANIDTGVQWNHPALVNQFACPGDPGNPNCWRDPSNICPGGTACDNNGHGTHTMGTMVGDDNPALTYIVGMAPNAKWIACKGCESTSCSDFALNSCADWILAPNGNSANRPNVVNNSWGDVGGDSWFQVKVQAWVASGIFPAFSAGNSGPTCSTLGSPGDYQESFGSAAHGSSRTIASFSSRGPSTYGHDPYTKPNISAPGVGICSSVPTNGWSCGYSGTSMASPHSAGAVALLWSCNPSLIGQIDQTFQILQNNTDAASAGTCGAPPDGQGNYTFGYGYLNILSAGDSACAGVNQGTLEGHVFETGGNPIVDATITTNIRTVKTDPSGYYSISLMVGAYDVTASKNGYGSQTANSVPITSGGTTIQNFTLTYFGSWNQVTLPSGCPDLTRFDAEYYPGTRKAYILGGRSDTSTQGAIYSFDPFTKTCANTGKSMPVPISNYTIVPLNDGNADLLCTFGGRDLAGNMTNVLQCYNPVTNSVITKASLPSAFDTFLPGGVAMVNNKAYIFGGYRQTSPYNTNVTYEYDPIANSYIARGNLTYARAYIDVAVVDGKIYGFGGDVFDGTNLIAQTKTEVFDPLTGTWNDASIADLPTASGEGRAYGFDSDSLYELAGKIILAGGGQWPAESNGTISYDVTSNTYTGYQTLNVSRRDHAGFFVPGIEGTMWVFGGRTDTYGDIPPYAPPEFLNVVMVGPKIYLPYIKK